MSGNHIDKEVIFTFLENHRLGTLCTVSRDGGPDGAAVYYFIDKGFNIFFITKTNTEKYKEIRQNPDVVLVVVDENTKDIAKIRGKASALTDQKVITGLFEKLADKLNTGETFDTVLPILKREGGNISAIKITCKSIRMSRYGGEDLQEETVYF